MLGPPPAQPREGTQSCPVVLHVSWLSSPPQSPALLIVIFNSLRRLLSPRCAFPVSTDDHTICLPEKGEIFGKEDHPFALPEKRVRHLQLRPPSPLPPAHLRGEGALPVQDTGPSPVCWALSPHFRGTKMSPPTWIFNLPSAF